MTLHHVVTLSNERALGLDRYNASLAEVCSAREVLLYIERPRGDPTEFVTKHALERFEEARTFLDSLDDAMVFVAPFGMVVGEYLVQPYLITRKQYLALEYVGAV